MKKNSNIISCDHLSESKITVDHSFYEEYLQSTTSNIKNADKDPDKKIKMKS